MPKKLSEVLAETFKHAPTPGNLKAWADSQETVYDFPVLHPGNQPIKGQLELPFCLEINTEFTSDARPGADWGTWQ